MLAIIVIALLPVLPHQEPAPLAPAASAASGREEAPAAASAPPAQVVVPIAKTDACLQLLRDGKRAQAQACYAARAGDDDDTLAQELAELVGTLKLTPPAELSLQSSGIDMGELLRSGKAELIATSTLVGAYTAGLATHALVSALEGGGNSRNLDGLMLLAPTVGGASAGIALSAVAVLHSKDLTSGDVDVVRALMLLGTFDSIMVPLLSGSSRAGTLMSMSMLVVQSLGIAAGGGVAVFTDLHEGAGSLAISAGLWTSVLSLLVAHAGGAFKASQGNGVLLITAAANVGFIGGLVGAQWLPMSRGETWAIDVGGGVGLFAGLSVAVLTRAPNPLIGYGTIAAGTAIGIGAGFAVARYLPLISGDLPEIVALAPAIFDDVDGRAMSGLVAVGRF